jgi:hypothetical protein
MLGMVRASKVLLSSGRVPNVEELGLETVGVEVTRAGITVDDHMRTNVEGIWAAGDVTASIQLTPVAQYQARLAVENMFGGDVTADYSDLPMAIFTDPELAQIGLTEDEAREQGFEPDTVRHELRDVQRASYTDTKRGLFQARLRRAEPPLARRARSRPRRQRHRPGDLEWRCGSGPRSTTSRVPTTRFRRWRKGSRQQRKGRCSRSLDRVNPRDDFYLVPGYGAVMIRRPGTIMCLVAVPFVFCRAS